MNNNIKFLRLLFVLNGVFWILLAMGWLSKIDAFADKLNTVYFNSSIMFFNAFVFIILAFLLKSKNKWIYYLALSYVLTNVYLTIAEEFSQYDLAILFLETLLTIILFKNRNYYINSKFSK